MQRVRVKPRGFPPTPHQGFVFLRKYFKKKHQRMRKKCLRISEETLRKYLEK
jgi:hypothetical protein